MERMLAIAKAQVGYLEKATNANLDDKTANAGNKNYTKYARDLDALGAYAGKKQGLAWCDMFCDWCFVQAYGFDTAMRMTCQPVGKYGAGCDQSAGYYRAQGRFFAQNPQVGDQIFFANGNDMYHTGLVVGVTDDRVLTIEGNTSSKAGVVENGGAVAEKSYSLRYSKIAGYGRPDYTLAPPTTPPAPVQTASAWSLEARTWAVEQGLMQGDANGDMRWQDTLTREEFVTVLHRKWKMEN